MSQHLHVHKPPVHIYKPPAQVLPRLGKIIDQLGKATPVANTFRAPTATIFVLPSGALYIEGSLQLDTDGWHAPGKTDKTHLDGTSLNYRDSGQHKSGQHDKKHHHSKRHNLIPINANAVPYFVLPSGNWPHNHGIGLGDFGVVLSGSRMCFAIYADNGPPDKLGEGSLALFRSLGQERLSSKGKVIDLPMGPGVVTIVFPRSAVNSALHNQAILLTLIDSIGQQRFANLGGNTS